MPRVTGGFWSCGFGDTGDGRRGNCRGGDTRGGEIRGGWGEEAVFKVTPDTAEPWPLATTSVNFCPGQLPQLNSHFGIKLPARKMFDTGCVGIMLIIAAKSCSLPPPMHGTPDRRGKW